MLCFLQPCVPYLKLQATVSRLEMEGDYIGLLKVRVIRGMDLVPKDFRSSDPYVVVRLGNQSVKTMTVKRNLNPFWDDELTIGVPSANPQLEVEAMDKDSFSSDESLGSAKVDLVPFVNVAKKREGNKIENEEKEVTRLVCSQNRAFYKDSRIFTANGEIKQELPLQLENVQTGKVDVELRWVYI